LRSLLLGFGVNEIGKTFSLRKVQLPVQEPTFGKLARLRQTQTRQRA
jgi:hypothetical protein